MKSGLKWTAFLAGMVLFLGFGASNGYAQCSASISSVTTFMRSQGTFEQLGTVTVACTVTPATSVSSNISVAVDPSTVIISPGSGASVLGGWTSTCSATAADFRSTMPCPSLTSTLAPVAQPTVLITGHTIVFNFTPAAGLQTFTIQGIRINGTSPGTPLGGAITGTVAASGGIQGLNPVVLGVLSSLTASNSGFANPGVLTMAACSPSVPTPAGTPGVVFGNPDVTPTANNSLRVILNEGFPGSFAGAATSDDGSPGLQGVRFRIQLSGIPSGVSVYAPEIVNSGSLSNTGTVVGGSALTAMTLVQGAAADGSGGIVNVAAIPNNFDLIPTGTGSVTIVYEVTTSGSPGSFETVTIFIALTGTAPTALGNIGGSVNPAPVGPPTSAGALPQFAGTNRLTLVAAMVSCTAGQPGFPPPPSVITSTQKLSFIAPVGSNAGSGTFDVLTIGNTPLNWSASITNIIGGNWLALSPTSGTGNTTVTATVTSGPLPPGSYSATVTILSVGAVDSPFTMTITLDVAGALLNVSPPSLSFSSNAGTNPAPQQLTITASAGILTWSASATTTTGGNWLSVTQSGSTPGTATVNINVGTLPGGTYQGAVTLSSTRAGNGQQLIPVTLTLGAVPPTISTNGLANGASFSKDATFAVGAIVTIFGQNLATATVSAQSLPLPTALGSAQVLVNESPAPLFYVSPTQINFQMPVTTSGSAQVVVVTSQLRGNVVTVTLVNGTPGIFTSDSSGSGQGAVLNQDASLNTAQNPAAAGTVISIYATGLGPTDPPIIAGQAPAAQSPTLIKPVVLIGGVAADVLFSGLAPGFVGLYQINARISTGTQPGSAVPLSLSIGGAVSNTVTIAVR